MASLSHEYTSRNICFATLTLAVLNQRHMLYCLHDFTRPKIIAGASRGVAEGSAGRSDQSASRNRRGFYWSGDESRA